MKKLRFRFILILFLVGISVYRLYYTYADYKNQQKVENVKESVREDLIRQNIPQEKIPVIVQAKADSSRLSIEDFDDDKEKAIKLGLDLQGGMYIVMEVNTAKLLEKLARDADDTFMQALKEAENESKINDEDIVVLLNERIKAKGLKLNRYFGTIRDDEETIISNLSDQAEDAVSRAIEIIRNRVDQYGVSEPSIQRQGARRIIVELPGVSREEEAKALLQGQALLEFRLVKDPQFTFSVMQKVDEILAGKTDQDSLFAENDTTNAAEEQTKEEFAKEHPFFALAKVNPQSGSADAIVGEDDKERLALMLSREEVQNAIPGNIEFLFTAKPEYTEDGLGFYRLILVNKNAELTGGVITEAMAMTDPGTAQTVVTMKMNGEGSMDWARITGQNIGKRIAIVLDNVIYSAPVVRNKIPSGSSQIEGMGSFEEGKLLEIVLKAGALPAPVDIIEERTVGPSLGQDSVTKGFQSALWGFIVVAIFMVIYYQKSGAVADVALMLVIVFILGILAWFNATLTLPGIAGIVLTMGMAVDANVLIYERIREELRTGKTVRAAVDSGFANSYSAIIDSNITTFFTGIILYQFGSGPIQGFALTLMIGILASLFGALVITRLVFDYMTNSGSKISIG